MDEITPTTDVVPDYYQKTTPIKARVQGAIDFLEKKKESKASMKKFFAQTVFLMLRVIEF